MIFQVKKVLFSIGNSIFFRLTDKESYFSAEFCLLGEKEKLVVTDRLNAFRIGNRDFIPLSYRK